MKNMAIAPKIMETLDPAHTWVTEADANPPIPPDPVVVLVDERSLTVHKVVEEVAPSMVMLVVVAQHWYPANLLLKQFILLLFHEVPTQFEVYVA